METALEAGAAHVGFADQDDVWEPGKLEEELGLLRDREAELGHPVSPPGALRPVGRRRGVCASFTPRSLPISGSDQGMQSSPVY